MTGRQFVEALAAGRAEPPPMARLVGLRVATVGDGDVVVACDADEAFYNPMGVVHGGLLCTLLDTAMALAAYTLLPDGASFSTIEIKVNFMRSVRASDGELRASGRVAKRGSRVAFTEGDVRVADGSTVATATSTLLVHDRAAADTGP